MTHDTTLTLMGTVVDVLPNTTFKVQIENNNQVILCYASGSVRLNKIRILKGDNVKIEVSVYDLTRGRIIRRL